MLLPSITYAQSQYNNENIINGLQKSMQGNIHDQNELNKSLFTPPGGQAGHAMTNVNNMFHNSGYQIENCLNGISLNMDLPNILENILGQIGNMLNQIINAVCSLALSKEEQALSLIEGGQNFGGGCIGNFFCPGSGYIGLSQGGGDMDLGNMFEGRNMNDYNSLTQMLGDGNAL